MKQQEQARPEESQICPSYFDKVPKFPYKIREAERRQESREKLFGKPGGISLLWFLRFKL